VVHIHNGDFGTVAGLVLESLMELGYQQLTNKGGLRKLWSDWLLHNNCKLLSA